MPSPQFHEYDTTDPSGSEDAEASTFATDPDTDAVKLAVGATLPAAPRPRALWLAAWATVNSVG